MFNFKTTKKQIEVFERNVAEILKFNFPEIKETLDLALDHYTIQFYKKPTGIYLLRDHKTKKDEKIHLNNNSSFDLYGLKIFNKKRNEFEAINLFFNNNRLTMIEVENPEIFHKTYDYCKLQIGELRTKEVYDENHDQNITIEILKNISQEKLNQLELDKAFEIEINENLYYTILDMNEGNYIAVTKAGKVYRLNHKHIVKVKEIANDLVSFFHLYKGSKSNLTELMYQ